MKRGHTNAEANKTRRWDEIDPKVDPGVACIPISGGASPSSTRDFPPLSLRIEEWQTIGRKMGWMQ